MIVVDNDCYPLLFYTLCTLHIELIYIFKSKFKQIHVIID